MQGRIFPFIQNIVQIICNKSIGFKTSERMSKFCNWKIRNGTRKSVQNNIYVDKYYGLPSGLFFYLKQSAKFIQNKYSLDCVKGQFLIWDAKELKRIYNVFCCFSLSKTQDHVHENTRICLVLTKFQLVGAAQHPVTCDV